MTKEHEASRTLVKSPPELWAECSDAGSLARHLGEFGEIRITRLDPETTVAWEGEHASGTVRIEPSGWGTRVTLTAQTKADAVIAPVDETPEDDFAPEAEAEVEFHPVEEERDAPMEETLEEPDPIPVAGTSPGAPWRRMTARMRGLFGGRRALELEQPYADAASAPEETGHSVPPPEPERLPEQISPEEDRIDAASERLAPPEQIERGQLDPEPDLSAEAILASALDSLGQAHHRPFSRA